MKLLIVFVLAGFAAAVQSYKQDGTLLVLVPQQKHGFQGSQQDQDQWTKLNDFGFQGSQQDQDQWKKLNDFGFQGSQQDQDQGTKLNDFDKGFDADTKIIDIRSGGSKHGIFGLRQGSARSSQPIDWMDPMMDLTRGGSKQGQSKKRRVSVRQLKYVQGPVVQSDAGYLPTQALKNAYQNDNRYLQALNHAYQNDFGYLPTQALTHSHQNDQGYQALPIQLLPFAYQSDQPYKWSPSQALSYSYQSDDGNDGGYQWSPSQSLPYSYNS